MIELIAFDADDTLWPNESYFFQSQKEYARLMSVYGSKEEILERLHNTQMKNLGKYGYGIKAYTLSMIDNALEISSNNLSGEITAQILELGTAMITKPVTPLENVALVLERLSKSHQLITITKGDLLDQNRKMERSGLQKYFSEVIVVSEKDNDTYQEILDQRNVTAEKFLMVGNSMKSDILPVLNIGGYGAYVPFEFTWQHERVNEPVKHEKLFELKEMQELLNLKFFN
ncbi:MAG: HAD family hydrolase [Marinifilaceae bacterium]|jgi:putative hydrolase of the HAD superfamily